MPKFGSQLLVFVKDGLWENKYPNLQWYDNNEMRPRFSLKHMNKRNKKYPKEYAKIYEDYYKLKKPGCPLVSWTKMKGMLDAALNRRGSKYIRFVKREFHEYIYEINDFGYSSGSDSPASTSTSEEQWSENADSSSESKMHDFVAGPLLPKVESGVDSLNLSTEILDGNYMDSYIDYTDNGTLSFSSLEPETMYLESTENVDVDKSCIERMPDIAVGTPQCVPQAVVEIDVKSENMQELNENVQELNENMQELNENMQKLNYCDRSLEISKVGDEYTYIFKSVSNSLPLNDPIFLFLSKMCCPA